MLSGAVAGARQPAPLGGLAPFALAVRGRSVRVSAASGNASLSIPIFAKPGRGVPFAVNLTYNSNVFVNLGAAFGRNYAYGSGWTVGPALGSISNTTTQIYTRGNPQSGTCQ